MSTEQTRNVSLTAEMNAFIRDLVACGRYQNASEVVRTGLRLLQDYERGLARDAGSVIGQKVIEQEASPLSAQQAVSPAAGQEQNTIPTTGRRHVR